MFYYLSIKIRQIPLHRQIKGQLVRMKEAMEEDNIGARFSAYTVPINPSSTLMHAIKQLTFLVAPTLYRPNV